MLSIRELPPDMRRSLIEHCARELNFVRFGNRSIYYLNVAEYRREVEGVLVAADTWLANVQEKAGRLVPPG